VLKVLRQELVHPSTFVRRALRLSQRLLFLSISDPGVEERLPIEVGRRNIDDTVSGDGSRRGISQVLDFEGHFGGVKHRNTLGIGQRKNLVVIKHSVQILDPNSIDRTITANPVVSLVRFGVFHLPDLRENARLPFTHLVHNTEHLLTSNGLGVHLGDNVLVVTLNVGESISEGVEDRGLTATSSSDYHKSVTYSGGFVQLDNFEKEVVLLLQVSFLELSVDFFLLSLMD